jgi:hypothetical protein
VKSCNPPYQPIQYKPTPNPVHPSTDQKPRFQAKEAPFPGHSYNASTPFLQPFHAIEAALLGHRNNPSTHRKRRNHPLHPKSIAKRQIKTPITFAIPRFLLLILASLKILSFGNKKKASFPFVFHSFIRIFAER